MLSLLLEKISLLLIRDLLQISEQTYENLRRSDVSSRQKCSLLDVKKAVAQAQCQLCRVALLM